MSRHLSFPFGGALTPDEAGWSYAGLQVLHVPHGETVEIYTADGETFVLPLAGSLAVEVSGMKEGGGVEAGYELRGRHSVFTSVTDFAYVGRDSRMTLSSEFGAQVALPSARCSRRLPPRYGPAEAVPVEVRGSGQATRQLTNFGVPGVWGHAERLICCEVITPAGNWSSYPPHKHDLTEPCPVANEEIYYYRVAEPDGLTTGPTGYGLHVTSTADEHERAGLPPLTDRFVVRDGDVVLVPYGYHGPCAAAPDHDLYYLNVLAGAVGRSMAFCDHPEQAWVRDSWNSVEPDCRVPLTSAHGRVSHGTKASRT